MTERINSKNRIYAAIDLKSFYASVECMERGLDPMTTNLVVADKSRTEKTICLAVTPSLKSYGIPGRARLFEVVQSVKEINAKRLNAISALSRSSKELRDKISFDGNIHFTGESFDKDELENHPELALSYITAPPRMAHYMEYSANIYATYLKYVSPDDIQPYSIDEVFIDLTDYLKLYNMTARELCMTMILDVLKSTGITATCGIGTNLYLAKIAMDVYAKHIPADANGVRIAELDEMSYRKELWDHKPITDFWRVGKGFANKLASHGIFTMGDVARCSLGKPSDFHNEDLLYKLFGVSAELLIDHAWGYEPCTIKDIKSYHSKSNSLTFGQVLSMPYSYDKALLVATEMAEHAALALVRKGLTTDQIVLTINYDVSNLENPNFNEIYHGKIVNDFYGRPSPEHAHGTENLRIRTSSSKIIMDATIKLFKRIVNPNLTIRRITIVTSDVLTKEKENDMKEPEQLNLFSNIADSSLGANKSISTSQLTSSENLKNIIHSDQTLPSEEELEHERIIQETMLKIKNKFGKNSIVKAMNLEEGATEMERNQEIGGHKA